MRRHKRYLRPKLTVRLRSTRIKWSSSNKTVRSRGSSHLLTGPVSCPTSRVYHKSRMPKVEQPILLPQPAVRCPVPGPSEAREEILEAVQRACRQYEQDRLQACCLSLLTSWRGCLADGGGNRYESHTGLRIQAKNGKDLLGVPRAVVEEARAALARLEEEAETLQGGRVEAQNEEESDGGASEESEGDSE